MMSPLVLGCSAVLEAPLKPQDRRSSVRLTDTAIAKAAREVTAGGQRRDVSDAGCPGLRLRLTPKGSKTWVLACRDRLGRMRRFTLGSYPQKGIADARHEARYLHSRVREEGADPTADRRRDRATGGAAKLGRGTLLALLDAYEEQRGLMLKSWPHSRKRVERVFNRLLKQPLPELTATDLQLAADAYKAKASASHAVRHLRPVLRWGAQRQHVPAALAEIQVPTSVKQRKRVLSQAELAALLPVLRSSSRPAAVAMQFMLLTLARREEVAHATWRHVDVKAATWTIPETKNGQVHVVPLSHQAADLLKRRKPIMAKLDQLVFASREGTPPGNWDRETKALMKASCTSGWTRHDLRRTGATMLGDMGELPDIIEAALNHVAIRSQLAATYNRSRYRPQVAIALQRLADALDEIAVKAASLPGSESFNSSLIT